MLTLYDQMTPLTKEINMFDTILSWLIKTARPLTDHLLYEVSCYFDKNKRVEDVPWLLNQILNFVGSSEFRQQLSLIKSLIHGLHIDPSRAGEINLIVQLNGEKDAINVRIYFNKLQIQEKYFLEITAIKTERVWLELSLRHFVLKGNLTENGNPTIEVPFQLCSILR